jgi:hypothetical protein
MKLQRIAWCLGLVVLVVSTCFAQSVLDQSFTGPYDNVYWLFYTGPGAVAQVYTAGITGNLTSVNLSVGADNGGPVVVQILDATTQINNPWPILGYTMITPPSQICNGAAPACGLASASFSPPVPQAAGKQYAIAVFPTNWGQIWFGASSTSTSAYAGGNPYYSGPMSWTAFNSGLPSYQQIASFYFQTYVKPTRKK